MISSTNRSTATGSSHACVWQCAFLICIKACASPIPTVSGQILESGRRLLTLIDHILGFSKSHANELSFEASGTTKSGQHSNLLRFPLAGGGRSGMTRIRFVRELVFVKVSAAEEGHAIEDVFLEPVQAEINHGRNVEGEQL